MAAYRLDCLAAFGELLEAPEDPSSAHAGNGDEFAYRNSLRGAVESAAQSMEFASRRSSEISSVSAGMVRASSVYVVSVAARDMSSSWRGICAWRAAVYATASSVTR